MSKTVGTNLFVAKAFVAQSHDARSGNGNLWSSGNILNSYRTPIAKLHTAVSGTKIILATDYHYSATTEGKHMNALWRATDYGRRVPMFRVPSIDGSHPANQEYLLSVHNAELLRIGRARKYKNIDRLTKLADDIRVYADAFGVEAPIIATYRYAGT